MIGSAPLSYLLPFLCNAFPDMPLTYLCHAQNICLVQAAAVPRMRRSVSAKRSLGRGVGDDGVALCNILAKYCITICVLRSVHIAYYFIFKILEMNLIAISLLLMFASGTRAWKSRHLK